MRDEAVRVRQLPAGEGIGGEALVNQRKRRLRAGVEQVLVEAADLRREQQALVDDGARREGWDVEIREAGQVALSGELEQRVLGLLADREDLALERVLVGRARSTSDDRLADDRHGLEHGRAKPSRVGRHFAPAEQHLAFDLYVALEPCS